MLVPAAAVLPAFPGWRSEVLLYNCRVSASPPPDESDLAPNATVPRSKMLTLSNSMFLDRGTFMKPEGVDGELLKGV